MHSSITEALYYEKYSVHYCQNEDYFLPLFSRRSRICSNVLTCSSSRSFESSGLNKSLHLITGSFSPTAWPSPRGVSLETPVPLDVKFDCGVLYDAFQAATFVFWRARLDGCFFSNSARRMVYSNTFSSSRITELNSGNFFSWSSRSCIFTAAS